MLTSWSVPALRQALRERGMDSRGGKRQLQKRLESALDRDTQQQQQQQQHQQQQLQQQVVPVMHEELLVTSSPTPRESMSATDPTTAAATATATVTTNSNRTATITVDSITDVNNNIPNPSSPAATRAIQAPFVPPSISGRIRVTISLHNTAKQSMVLITTSAAPSQCKHNFTLLLATASNKFRTKVKRMFVASTGEELLPNNLHTVFSAILTQGGSACKAVVTTGQTYVAPSSNSAENEATMSPDLAKSVMTDAQASLVDGKIDSDGWPQPAVVQQLIAQHASTTQVAIQTPIPMSPPTTASTSNSAMFVSPLPTTTSMNSSDSIPVSDMSTSSNPFELLRQHSSSPTFHPRILYSDSSSPHGSPTLPSSNLMSRHPSFSDFELLQQQQTSVYGMLTAASISSNNASSTTTTNDTPPPQSAREMELLEKRCKRLEAEAKQAARTEKKQNEEIAKLTAWLATARTFEDKYKECASSLAKSEQIVAKLTRENAKLTHKNKTLATQNLMLKEQAVAHETNSEQKNKLQQQLDALTGADQHGHHAIPKSAEELQYLLQIHSTGLARVHQAMSIALEAERRALRERKLCKICMDSPLECLLLPCSHYVLCEKCSTKVTQCPICRRRIEERKPVYM